VNWKDFREWANNKYSKSWARDVFYYAKKYHGMLIGNFKELESFSKSKRNNVLKAVIALSKYLGTYSEFKAKMANYGVKWQNQNSFESFIRILETKDGTLDWVQAATKVSDQSYAAFIEFVMISGIRASEAINSFNTIIRLHKAGRLGDYYNTELQSLEHFRFQDKFIRGTKNVFFSFIPETFVEQVTCCDLVSYSGLMKRLRKHGLKVRLNELRDYFATFMVHNGLIREEVDLLQGRIGQSIFMRHYFSPDLESMRDKVLRAIQKMTERAGLTLLMHACAKVTARAKTTPRCLNFPACMHACDVGVQKFNL
jgi:intergrase/recombinase